LLGDVYGWFLRLKLVPDPALRCRMLPDVDDLPPAPASVNLRHPRPLTSGIKVNLRRNQTDHASANVDPDSSICLNIAEARHFAVAALKAGDNCFNRASGAVATRTLRLQVEPHILIVDDDLEIRKLLGRYLVEQGFRVTLASDKRTLKSALESNDIKLIVLDVMLPDGSGLDICRDMRTDNSHIPIILLTALKEDFDRIVGLEIGADDYLGKPFNPRELAARIRAVLRRQNDAVQLGHLTQEYRFDGFRLQPRLRQVVDASGGLLDLTSAEFDLLHALVAKSGRLLSREYLLDATNRGGGDKFDRSVDVLLSRIRRKLGDIEFRLIKTVRNGGYVFTANVERVGASE
jgi:two-component system OmpR family response regulator